MASVAEDIIHSYTYEFDETTRLSADIGPLEFARTKELLQRLLAPAPATVVDVGGAAGPYSFWLAAQGYSAHLLDIVPRHIERAKARQAEEGSPRLAGMHLGDARKLPFDNCMADAVMVHGPLYHFPDQTDRIAALKEARRIVKPDGLVLAFGITRYAGLIHGITTGKVFDPQYRDMLTTEVRTGRRLRARTEVTCFRSAYFHLPSEMEAEAEQAGLRPERTLGVLGPAWQVPELEKSWSDPVKQQTILEIARLTEDEPVLGPRFVTVCRRVV